MARCQAGHRWPKRIRVSLRPARRSVGRGWLLVLLAGLGAAGSAAPRGPVDHRIDAPATPLAAAASESGRTVPFFPSASSGSDARGLVRVINRSAEAGEVSVSPSDDEGRAYGPLTLSLGANAAAHFDSDDLENGNPARGLTGAAGRGQGDWRLRLASALDVEVLSYVLTQDGFLTAMGDTLPWGDGGLRAAIFNPGSNMRQRSLLRLVNLGETAAAVSIAGVDDTGASSAGPVTVEIPSGAVRTYSAAELEAGDATGLTGSLGDGAGKWRLSVRSEEAIMAMSLLASPDGHVTNLSTAPIMESAGIHAVPFFPSASDPFGRQGFVRVINHAQVHGEVSVRAFDDTGREYETLTLDLGAGETRHFNSNDLESGNAAKGLAGGTGAGSGDWRLELASDLAIEVLAYLRTTRGFVTSVHDTVALEDGAHRVGNFHPESSPERTSLLRLVNGDERAARVTIAGMDDEGVASSSDVTVSVPPGASRTVAAGELEAGFGRALGSEGGWRLVARSDRPITVLKLLSSPEGPLTNLSIASAGPMTSTLDFHRGPQEFVADFADYPPADRDEYELVSGYRALPVPFESRSALSIGGDNHSDDLFMFFKGQVGGLAPGARYAVRVGAEIATDTPAGCFGIGGAPGESVYVKAGVSEIEPAPVLEENSWLRMNVDIGSQSNGGEHAVVLGDVANARPCEEPRRWERKSFPKQALPEPVTVPPSGRVWLLFGTDSGFEGRTEVYFTRATVAFTPM